MSDRFRPRFRGLAAISAITLLTMVVMYALITWQPEQQSRRGFEEKSLTVAALLAANVRTSVVFEDAETALKDLKAAEHERLLSYVAVRGHDAKVLASLDRKAVPEIPGLIGPARTAVDDGALYHVSVPVLDGESTIGWLQAGFHQVELHETLARTRYVSLLLVVILGAVVFLSLSGVSIRAEANRMLLEEIAATAEKLRTSSSGILLACNEQAVTTNEQAGSIEETQRTMSALLEAAKRIAESSQQVFENADLTNRSTGTAAAAIRVLTAQAQKIGEISEVIRSISDKSDLLALNASLEGTKSGEAGRGFALVAAEMRRLAESVMGAAREIKQLAANIRAASDSSVAAVEEGRALASRTSDSARVITLVTQQQRNATEQITQSMDEVRHLLSRSARSTQQTEAAARELSSWADQLSQLTARSVGTKRAAPAPAPAQDGATGG